MIFIVFDKILNDLVVSILFPRNFLIRDMNDFQAAHSPVFFLNQHGLIKDTFQFSINVITYD